MRQLVVFIGVVIGVLTALLGIPFGGSSYKVLHQGVGSQVMILSSTPDAQGGGTGFALQTEDDTNLITNAHVCRSSLDTKTMYAIPENGSTYKVQILYVDVNRDLCALSLPARIASPFEGLKSAGNVTYDEPVHVVGHPQLEALRVQSGHILKDQSIVVGMPLLSFIERTKCTETGGRVLDLFFFALCLKEYQALHTEAMIYPGNSGSPLVNDRGQVVGVIFAGSGATGFAVPLRVLKEFLKNFKISQTRQNTNADAQHPRDKAS